MLTLPKYLRRLQIPVLRTVSIRNMPLQMTVGKAAQRWFDTTQAPAHSTRGYSTACFSGLPTAVASVLGPRCRHGSRPAVEVIQANRKLIPICPAGSARQD